MDFYPFFQSNLSIYLYLFSVNCSFFLFWPSENYLLEIISKQNGKNNFKELKKKKLIIVLIISNWQTTTEKFWNLHLPISLPLPLSFSFHKFRKKTKQNKSFIGQVNKCMSFFLIITLTINETLIDDDDDWFFLCVSWTRSLYSWTATAEKSIVVLYQFVKDLILVLRNTANTPTLL